MTAKELAGVLNENADRIIERLSEREIATYVFLKERLKERNITRDAFFRDTYEWYYGMKDARLPLEWKNAYFTILERAKKKTTIKLLDTCKKLYAVHPTVQFSFTSKIAHSINDIYPIYDRHVANVLGLTSVYSKKELQRKLIAYADMYETIISTYQAVIENKLANKAFKKFDNKFSSYSRQIGSVKKLDFLVWAWGRLNKK